MAYTITEKCDGCRLCVSLCPVLAISGTKKKLHKINAAVCVACGVCGRICKPEAVLDDTGVVCKSEKRSLWPKPVFDLEICTACSACVQECPVNAIGTSFQKKKDLNLYPYLENTKKCISCNFCTDICPIGAIVLVQPLEPGQRDLAG